MLATTVSGLLGTSALPTTTFATSNTLRASDGFGSGTVDNSCELLVKGLEFSEISG